MPLNILHFSQDFRKDKAQLGAFSRIFNLTLDGNHHQIFTIHFEDEAISVYPFEHIEIISIGIGTRKLRGRYERSLGFYLRERILSYLKANQTQVDVIFGHSQLINFNILHYIQKKLHKPLVWEVNAIWGLPLLSRKLFAVRLYRYLAEQLAFRTCNHLIAQTQQTKQVIQKYYAIPEQKITVVTNGVDHELFKQRKLYVRSFSDSLCQVYIVGRFDELNGIDFILENIEKFDSNQIQLNLVGDGNNLERIARLQDVGKLTYHGPVSYSQMPEIYQRADILLIPRIRCFLSDLYIPTKLLEGLASGLVVLGSDVKGITDVIQDGENGFLFQAGEAQDMIKRISYIISLDNAQLNKIGDEAIKRSSEHFSMIKNSEKINSVYHQMLQPSVA